jgi:hypothetical protein
VHVFKFLLAEMENDDGIAKLKNFVTSLGSIATFFTLEPKLQFG